MGGRKDEKAKERKGKRKTGQKKGRAKEREGERMRGRKRGRAKGKEGKRKGRRKKGRAKGREGEREGGRKEGREKEREEGKKEGRKEARRGQTNSPSLKGPSKRGNFVGLNSFFTKLGLKKRNIEPIKLASILRPKCAIMTSHFLTSFIRQFKIFEVNLPIV